MVCVTECVWPVRASTEMRPALATALRSMARLAEVEPVRGGYSAEVSRVAHHRLTVYRGLATVLRVREEAALEPGAAVPEAVAERDRILELSGDAQGVFLALLALARHRLETEPGAPGPAGPEMAAFDRAVHRTREATAAAIEGDGHLGLRRELAQLEEIRARPPMRVAAAAGQLQREIGVRHFIAGHIERLASRVLDDAAWTSGLRHGPG